MAQIIAVLSEIATFLAPPGVAPGASIYVADAALGTEQTDHQRTQGMITSSHQDLVWALPGDTGHIRHRLQTLEARGLIVIGCSPGGTAEALGLTPEGQK